MLTASVVPTCNQCNCTMRYSIIAIINIEIIKICNNVTKSTSIIPIDLDCARAKSGRVASCK